MARVLLAWEFGGDLGHVRRLLPIAGQLRSSGHDVALAFGELRALEGNAGAFECFQAPLLRPPSSPNLSPRSASDILLNLGYEAASSIAGALRAWIAIFGVWLPDVVVGDYAPTALLAARAKGIACVSVGSGFSMPLKSEPLASLRPGIASDQAALEAIDTRLVGAITLAFSRLRLSGAPRAAHEVFAASVEILCTFPEIDPFGPRPGAVYVGPVSSGAHEEAVTWQSAKGPRIFAYLKPRDPRFMGLLNALRSVGGESVVAAPGLRAEEAVAMSDGSLRVLPHAVALDAMLDHADLCVCHAGAGTAARALAAGVPLALLPAQLEQSLVARRLADAGVAEWIAPENPPEELAAWLRRVLGREELHAAAQAFAEKYRAHSVAAAVADTARRIVGVLES